MTNEKNDIMQAWIAWMLWVAILAVCITKVGTFGVTVWSSGLRSEGPLSLIFFIFSVITLVLLVTGIKQVSGEKKEFGHYFIFGKMSGFSLMPGIWPTYGSILTVKIFPGDQDLLTLTVNANCASYEGVAGAGPKISVDLAIEAALDPLHVSEILSLGSVEAVDMAKFRDELKKFVFSKLEERARAAINRRSSVDINADYFALSSEIIGSMWSGESLPPQGEALRTALQLGTDKLIQGLICSALRVTEVTEDPAIVAERTGTEVQRAKLITAKAKFDVAIVDEKINAMEAERFVENARKLQDVVPPEQIAATVGAINDKMKVSATIQVVSTNPNSGVGGAIATATAQGAALGQALNPSKE